MATHRYWRIARLETYGSVGLEISELHLFSGASRVDASATLSANIVPATGVITNLQDDDLATAAGWGAESVKTLELTWDFGGSPEFIDGFQIGATTSRVVFPLMITLYHSDDAVTWTFSGSVTGVAYPGARNKTAFVGGGFDPHFDRVSLLLHMEGANNSTVFTDASLRRATVTVVGTARVTTSSPVRGSGSLLLDASPAYLQLADDASLQFGADDFAVEVSINPTSLPGSGAAYGIVGKENDVAQYGWGFFLTNDAGVVKLNFQYSSNGTLLTNNAATLPGAAINTSFDLAVSRVGSTLYIFSNGALLNSFSIATSIFAASGAPLQIGRVNNDYNFPGRIDEVRITKGVGRYSATYAPTGLPFSEGGAGLPLNTVRGRADGAAPSVTPTLAVVSVYGNAIPAPLHGMGRNDYLTGVLGQGIGRVQGTVKDTPDTPVYRRVRLIRQRDGLLMREMWSDRVTGAYDFQYVDELQTYTVLSYDHTGNFRAVVADNLTPGLMP